MLDILYEDNHLVGVDKPCGLLTQPTEQENNSAETLLKAYIKEKYEKPGDVFLHAVHRIDKPVRGIVLFARTTKALTRLNASMRSGAIKKIYHAEIEGVLKEDEGEWIHRLVHGDRRALIDPGGKEARLRFRVTERRKTTTVVEIELLTGRYHQIRIQCSAMGHPILGDTLYGGKARREEGIALTHTALTFPHPTLKRTVQLKIYSPL